MKKIRILEVKIYLKDSSFPLYYEVKEMFTEGGLLRLVTIEDVNIWFPVQNIHCIKKIKEGNNE